MPVRIIWILGIGFILLCGFLVLLAVTDLLAAKEMLGVVAGVVVGLVSGVAVEQWRVANRQKKLLSLLCRSFIRAYEDLVTHCRHNLDKKHWFAGLPDLDRGLIYEHASYTDSEKVRSSLMEVGRNFDVIYRNWEGGNVGVAVTFFHSRNWQLRKGIRNLLSSFEEQGGSLMVWFEREEKRYKLIREKWADERLEKTPPSAALEERYRHLYDLALSASDTLAGEKAKSKALELEDQEAIQKYIVQSLEGKDLKQALKISEKEVEDKKRLLDGEG